MRYWILILLSFSALASASKFAPEEGKVLVLAGQNLRATQAYYEHPTIPDPAGFSDYISYDIGAAYPESAPGAPRIFEGNEGLMSAANWGAGDQCAQCLLEKEPYRPAVLNIGLYMAGPIMDDGSLCRAQPECHIHKIATGQYDEHLEELADWFESLNGMPVLLRIGYEFEGEWNNYDPEQYKAAYKYIHRYMNERGVDNVAYVFHSAGFAEMDTLRAYFPEPDEHSDRYVDWIGYSHFHIDPKARGENELKLARELGLKVFLGEVTPHTGDCKNQINVAKTPELAKRWVHSFFEHVERNKDVIAGIAYINADWSDRDYSPMWFDQGDQGCNGYFSSSNARLNDNDEVAKLWAEYVSRPMYINREEALKTLLDNK